MSNIDVTPIEQPHDGMNLFQQVSLARSICKEDKKNNKKRPDKGREADEFVELQGKWKW